MPLVSIIVPVFNVEPYIHRCINSILYQTYTDFELILVDDGSTDKSGSICDEYSSKDPRVKVIHNLNGGQSRARNAGIDFARGTFLSFIDADDYISPEMVETICGLAVKYDADIAECGYISVFNDKEVVCEFGKGIEFGEADFLIEKFLKGDIFYGVATKLFKSSLFKKAKFPSGRIFEDTWMTLNLCLEDLRYVRTNEALYYYNQINNSTLRSAITPRKAREYIYILEDQLALIDFKAKDKLIKRRLKKRIMEKSVFWYLGLALSDDKVLRTIYSKLYLKRMQYGLVECIISENIPVKNKVSFILCKAGLKGFVRFTKRIIS